MAKGIYVGASPNLVVNGDFSNGTNNWSTTSYANATVKSDETLGDYLHIEWVDTVTSGVVVYNSEMDFENGDIIYMSFIAKAYSSNTSITHCYVNTLIPDISNDDIWHNISVIGTADGTRSPLLSIYQSKPPAIGNKLDITNIKFFNLTNVFGAGNEPTKEWCDANLDILESRGVAHKVTKAYVGVESNLVVNGNFDNGLNSWEYSDNYYELSIAKEKDNNYMVAEVVNPATNATKTEVVNLGSATIGGHVVYARFDMKGETTNAEKMGVYLGVRFRESGAGSGSTFVLNSNFQGTEWVTSSGLTTIGEDGYIFLQLVAQSSSGTISSGMKLYFDNIALYDLTALFGAGNEPTKEWCDANFEALNKNVARKVKKGYIGVAGVARPFFSAEQKLEYYGTATDLSRVRANLAATSIGDYALFAGGTDGSYHRTTVDSYTSALVIGTPKALSKSRKQLAATSVGDYALFGGGSDNGKLATVDTYTSTLTKGTATDLSVARYNLAATSIGGYALFGGGNSSSASAVVDTYTSTLTKGTANNLSVARDWITATSVGDYALFGGGYGSSASAVVDTYTSTLVKGTANNLSVARYKIAATSIGNYALFGGGQRGSSSFSNVVDTYNTSLVKGTATTLAAARQSLSSTAVGDYALFCGGMQANVGTASAVVDTYTSNLVKGEADDMSVARIQMAATSIGDYALFGGGNNSDGYLAIVDVYQVV